MALMAIFLFSVTATAQVEYPAASPLAKIQQRVGITDIEIEYSRPSLKGRTPFVDVEKFGKIWRTGANASTKISFSNDVLVGGKPVPAGKYALYSIPGQSEWSVMLYSDLSLGGNVNGYDKSKEVVQVNVQAQTLPFSVETFTIDIGDITTDGANLGLIWGTHYVPVSINVKTEDMVTAGIEDYMKNPMASVGNNYAQAASYYYEKGKDLDRALTWIDKAIEINPNAFWNIQTKARILGKMERYPEAIEAARHSSEVAKAASDDFGYIEANQKLIDGWSAQ